MVDFLSQIPILGGIFLLVSSFIFWTNYFIVSGAESAPKQKPVIVVSISEKSDDRKKVNMFDNLPDDLLKKISGYISLNNNQKQNWNDLYVPTLNVMRDIANTALVNVKFNNIMKNTLHDVNCVRLITKYNVYNDDVFEKCWWKPDSVPIPSDFPPTLYDVVSTGFVDSKGKRFPFSRSTFSTYTEETERYIKSILKFIPDSAKFNQGELRCRDKVTPLYIAMSNNNISIDIVIEIAKRTPKCTIMVNNRETKVMYDLKENNIERYKELVNNESFMSLM